jgi:hypothetical protein
MNVDEQQQILEWYPSIGTEEIARRMSKHPSTIQKFLKKKNVLLPKQKYNHNRHFFETFTPESCYWAGMMLADGYVSQSKNLFGMHLQASDKPHLENFINCIGSNNELLYDKNSDAYCMQIYGAECKKGLMVNFNVMPKKSKTATYPTDIPEAMQNHFIRGIIDGDGSITFTTCPTLSIVGTVSVLDVVNSVIRRSVNYEMRTACKTMPSVCTLSENFGSLSFYGNTAKQVLNWVYDRSAPETRLHRKYLQYCDLFN